MYLFVSLSISLGGTRRGTEDNLREVLPGTFPSLPLPNPQKALKHGALAKETHSDLNR